MYIPRIRRVEELLASCREAVMPSILVVVVLLAVALIAEAQEPEDTSDRFSARSARKYTS